MLVDLVPLVFGRSSSMASPSAAVPLLLPFVCEELFLAAAAMAAFVFRGRFGGGFVCCAPEDSMGS